MISVAAAVVSFGISEPRKVPTPTIRFVKTLFYEKDPAGVIRSLLSSDSANKPIGVTPLMCRERPVWGRSGVIELRPGQYWFRVGAVLPQDKVMEFTVAVSTVADEVGGSLTLSVRELLKVREPPETFCVRTLTPAQIKAGSEFVSYLGLHDLLRSPMRVLSRVLHESLGIQYPTGWAFYFTKYYTGVRGWSRVVSLDLGRDRDVGGVVGEWCFRRVRRLPRWLAAPLAQALLVAQAVGVGKSRATGLGQVEVTYPVT